MAQHNHSPRCLFSANSPRTIEGGPYSALGTLHSSRIKSWTCLYVTATKLGTLAPSKGSNLPRRVPISGLVHHEHTGLEPDRNRVEGTRHPFSATSSVLGLTGFLFAMCYPTVIPDTCGHRFVRASVEVMSLCTIATLSSLFVISS